MRCVNVMGGASAGYEDTVYPFCPEFQNGDSDYRIRRQVG